VIGVLVGCVLAGGCNRVSDVLFVDTLAKMVKSSVEFVVAHWFLFGASE